MDHTYWRPQADFFSKKFRVLLYDWRGMGQSSGGEPPYRFAQLVEDLHALLAALAISRPVICAHSLGGDMALEYAFTYPESLSALIVLGAPGPGNFFTTSLSYVSLGCLSALAGLFGNPLAPFVPFFRYLFFSGGFPKTHPDTIRAWKAQFLANSRRSILNAGFAQAGRQDPIPRLREIAVPSLVTRGAEDRTVRHSELEAYHRGIRGSEMREFAGAGHSAMVEQPDVLNQAIEEFLASGLDRQVSAGDR